MILILQVSSCRCSTIMNVDEKHDLLLDFSSSYDISGSVICFYMPCHLWVLAFRIWDHLASSWIMDGLLSLFILLTVTLMGAVQLKRTWVLFTDEMNNSCICNVSAVTDTLMDQVQNRKTSGYQFFKKCIINWKLGFDLSSVRNCKKKKRERGKKAL